MTEIEKMFENAGIEPDCTYLFLVEGNGENEAARTISIGSKADLKRLIVDCGVKGKVIKSTNTLKPFYPDFTAEKQIELIKWLAKIYELSINWDEQYNSYRFVIRNYKNGRLNHSVCGYDEPFEETLAYLINRIWQSLTDQEKEEIRNISK